MTRERLAALLEKFDALRVAVMGDLFLDRWLTIDPRLHEPSVETGLDAWQVVESRCAAGAAGTVLNNLSALGVGGRYVISMIGADGEGYEVKRALAGRGVDMRWLVESEAVVTPSYIKPMMMQPDGRLLEANRMDRKNRFCTPGALEEALLRHMREAAQQVDAIVLLDQLAEENTGVVTEKVRREAARIAEVQPELLLYVDSRSFIGRFQGVTIKCNNEEAAVLTRQAAGEPFAQEKVFAALAALQQQTEKQVFVTCNKHGIAVQGQGRPVLVPAALQAGPIDVCGAGDACSAGIVGALCAGATPIEAAEVGNLCAGVTVRKLGTTGTASREEVLALYDEQYGEK